MATTPAVRYRCLTPRVRDARRLPRRCRLSRIAMTTEPDLQSPRLDDVLIINDSLPSHLGRRRDVWRLVAGGHDELNRVTSYATAERAGRRLARERCVTLWRAPVPGRATKQIVADFRQQTTAGDERPGNDDRPRTKPVSTSS